MVIIVAVAVVPRVTDPRFGNLEKVGDKVFLDGTEYVGYDKHKLADIDIIPETDLFWDDIDCVGFDRGKFYYCAHADEGTTFIFSNCLLFLRDYYIKSNVEIPMNFYYEPQSVSYLMLEEIPVKSRDDIDRILELAQTLKETPGLLGTKMVPTYGGEQTYLVRAVSEKYCFTQLMFMVSKKGQRIYITDSNSKYIAPSDVAEIFNGLLP